MHCNPVLWKYENPDIRKEKTGCATEEKCRYEDDPLWKRYLKGFIDLALETSRDRESFIRKMNHAGVKTAIASTAQVGNLMNALNYLQVADLFDKIIAGIDVKRGKPDPEIYLKAMEMLGVTPEETLIFEDSEVGLQAAEASGANYLKISGCFFE